MLFDTAKVRQAAEQVDKTVGQGVLRNKPPEKLASSSKTVKKPKPVKKKTAKQKPAKQKPAKEEAAKPKPTADAEPAQVTKDPVTLPSPEAADNTLKARIARELLAFAPRLEGDARLDTVSRHLSNRAQQELKNRSREAVDAWLHREVYGLLFSAADTASQTDNSTTRAEEMLARAADQLALSFTETSQQLMGQMQASAFEGERYCGADQHGAALRPGGW